MSVPHFFSGFYNHKVFLIFSDNLFNLNQILSAFNSTLIVCSISNIDLPDTDMSVSSANNMIKLDLHAVCISFTYNKNNRGPKIDPCGTPQLILPISDLTPLYTTYCCLSDKYFFSQLNATPLIP